ncbi:MAG TPA: hypothetical protein VK653_02860 [Xanthobacteraceae bacterium]|nr:hypothetical protein [Xanthobacteraceae bacterium]
MLNDVKQDNNVHHTKAREIILIRHSIDDCKAASSAKYSGGVCDFDSCHIVELTRLFEKKAIGASNL